MILCCMLSNRLQRSGLSIAIPHVPTACTAIVNTVFSSTVETAYCFEQKLALYDKILGQQKYKHALYHSWNVQAHRFRAGCFQLQRALFDQLCISKVQLRSGRENGAMQRYKDSHVNVN